MPGKSPADLHQKLSVQLMIQERICVENVSRQNISKLENCLAQHLHAVIELSLTEKNKLEKMQIPARMT
jgi:hypothetical protein